MTLLLKNMNLTEDWLLNDVLRSKIKQLCALLVCGSCGDFVTHPVFTDENNELLCTSCLGSSNGRQNKAWDNFVKFVENSRLNDSCNGCFNAKADQKVYSHRKDGKIGQMSSLEMQTGQNSRIPYADDHALGKSGTKQSGGMLQREDEEVQLPTEQNNSDTFHESEICHAVETSNFNPPFPLANEKEHCAGENDVEIKNGLSLSLCDNNDCGTMACDESEAGENVLDEPSQPQRVVTVQTAIKRKDGDTFHTPKSKRIALDSGLLQDLTDSNQVDVDGEQMEEMVQISMKDLKNLLRTAKKKAREEFEEHLQSTVKKHQRADSLLMEEGIVPIQPSALPLGEPPDNNLGENELKEKQICQSESGESDSDSDSFVPPTPKTTKKPVITSIMVTGLTAAHKPVVGKSMEEFTMKFSGRVSPVDVLIAGQKQVTLKWIFARVEGIPIVSVEWLDESLRSGELLPLDKFVLEKSFAVPVPKIFKSLNIGLCPAFTKYPEPDLMILLRSTGADVSPLESWSPSRSTKPFRMLVGDNASISYTEKQLIGLSSKFRAVVVDISYLLGVLESGRVKYLQPSLLVQVSDQLLAKLGFPSEMVTPED